MKQNKYYTDEYILRRLFFYSNSENRIKILFFCFYLPKIKPGLQTTIIYNITNPTRNMTHSVFSNTPYMYVPYMPAINQIRSPSLK